MAVTVDGWPVGYLISDQGWALVLDQAQSWMRDCGMQRHWAMCEAEWIRAGLPAIPSDGDTGRKQLRVIASILESASLAMQIRAIDVAGPRRILLMRAATIMAQMHALAD